MNLKPTRGYCLVKQIEDELKTSGGITLPETSKDKPIRGVVLALGLEPILSSEGTTTLPWECKVGDKIIFSKWGGQDITEDGKDYKLVAHKEILAVYASA